MFETGTSLDPLLDPGEKLLWSGQPRQGLRLQASDALTIPFSLIWCGFVFVWESAALGIGWGHHRPATPTDSIMSWVFPLWGLPFICVGLYMLVGRFFFDSASRRRTWYGVTDHRLIILKSLFGTKINSYDYATLINLNLVERGDRNGDVLFGTPNFAGDYPAAGLQSRRSAPAPGFYQLPNARAVYNQIRGIQQGKNERRGP